MNIFQRIYTAVFGIENYSIFLIETVKRSLKYLLSLTAILSLIISFSYVVFIGKTLNQELVKIDEIGLDFEVLDELNINLENQNQDAKNYIEKLEKENIYIKPDETTSNISSGIIFLKNDIEYINNGITYKFSYKDIEEELSKVSNYKIDTPITINVLKNIKFKTSYIIQIVLMCILISFVMFYFIILLYLIYGAILISCIANLLSYFMVPKIKYPKIFALTIYSSTLGAILVTLATCLNLIFGISINYLEFLYYSITLIYIIAAMYIIKHDFLEKIAQKAKKNEQLDEEKEIKRLEDEIDQLEKEKEEILKKDKELKKQEQEQEQEQEQDQSTGKTKATQNIDLKKLNNKLNSSKNEVEE